MKIPLNYGVLLAIAGIVINLVLYLLGFHNDSSKFEMGQHLAQVVGLIVTVVLLVMAMRAVRAKAPDGSLSYGRAVGTGTLTTLVSGVISAVYVLVYGMFINPDYHTLIHENALSKLTPEQADAAGNMMKFFTGPLWTSLMVLIISPLLGALLSLIIAIFVKKAPQPTGTPPPLAG